VIATVAAPVAGAGFASAHALWYRVLEQSVTVDVLGSLALGLVSATTHVLLVRTECSPGRVWTGVAFAVGFLAHLLLTPAFTPTSLAATGVNVVLFVVGAGVALGSVPVRGRPR